MKLKSRDLTIGTGVVTVLVSAIVAWYLADRGDTLLSERLSELDQSLHEVALGWVVAEVSARDDGTVDVSWPHREGKLAPTDYRVQWVQQERPWGDSDQFGGTRFVRHPIGSKRYVKIRIGDDDGRLSSATTYKFRVRPLGCEKGDWSPGSWSDEVVVRTLGEGHMQEPFIEKRGACRL